jgi:pSer/pThr/pTyr-binding forkhead associated (FHA) protein
MDVSLIVERGAAPGRRVRLRAAETIIGRQKGCDIRIPSAEISRRHCILTLADGELTVQDLDSSNGTFLNRQRVAGAQAIKAGDRLRVGPVTFSVACSRPPETHALPDSADSVADVAEPDEEAIVPIAESESAESPSPPPIPAGAPDVIPFKDDNSTAEIPNVELDDAEPLRLPDGEDLRELLRRMDK